MSGGCDVDRRHADACLAIDRPVEQSGELDRVLTFVAHDSRVLWRTQSSPRTTSLHTARAAAGTSAHLYCTAIGQELAAHSPVLSHYWSVRITGTDHDDLLRSTVKRASLMDPIYRAIDADSQPLAQARQLHDGSRALSSQVCAPFSLPSCIPPVVCDLWSDCAWVAARGRGNAQGSTPTDAHARRRVRACDRGPEARRRPPQLARAGR